MPYLRIPATYNQPLLGFINRCTRVIIVALLFMLFFEKIYGQIPSIAPNRLQVYAAQELSFGSFFTGSSGGTVVISPQGSRSFTGTVVGMASFPGAPAVFDVRFIQGRMVHMVFPSSATLSRIGGGGDLLVTGFTSDKPGDSFITTAAHPFINPVSIGATLNVGSIAENQPGSYSGSFTVTFVRE